GGGPHSPRRTGRSSPAPAAGRGCAAPSGSRDHHRDDGHDAATDQRGHARRVAALLAGGLYPNGDLRPPAGRELGCPHPSSERLGDPADQGAVMTVVVGYVPTAVGRAALRRAAQEAEPRGWTLVTVHSESLDTQFDQDEDDALEAERRVISEHLQAIGIEHQEIHFEGVRSVRGTDPSLPERGVDPGEDLIAVAEEV